MKAGLEPRTKLIAEKLLKLILQTSNITNVVWYWHVLTHSALYLENPGLAEMYELKGELSMNESESW